MSKATTAEVDIDSQIGWRLARAQALAGKGTLDEAELLAREALEFASIRDGLFQRGQALVVLAGILGAAGKHEEARAAADRALEQFRRKGSDLAVQQAQRRLETIAV